MKLYLRFFSFDISKCFKCHKLIFSLFVCFPGTTADRFYRIDRGQVLWRFASLLRVALCRFFYPTALHVSAGASKLCDGDLPGWAFHLGPGAGHQGDGGHVARNAGGDGSGCWGMWMFQQHRPVRFSCLLSWAFSTVQVDWNQSLWMTKCAVKLYQLVLLEPQTASRCSFMSLFLYRWIILTHRLAE